MLEKDIQKAIKAYLLTVKGAKFSKVHQQSYYVSERGIADFVGVYKGIFVALEVKTAKGRPSRHQIIWGKTIARAGGNYCVVRNVEDTKSKLHRISCGEQITDVGFPIEEEDL